MHVQVHFTNGASQSAYPNIDFETTVDGQTGCIKAVMKLKKQHPGLKILFSVSGGSDSLTFKYFASTPAGQQTFARSVRQWIDDYGFDGVDRELAPSTLNLFSPAADIRTVDWEHPDSPEKGKAFVELLATVRETALPSPFLITAAMNGGEWVLRNIDLPKLGRTVDLLHLMTYDFAGGWSQTSGHLANLYPDESENLVPTVLPAPPPHAVVATRATHRGSIGDLRGPQLVPDEDACYFSGRLALAAEDAKGADPAAATPATNGGDSAVARAVARGFPARKLVLGIPAYARYFVGAQGPHEPFTSAGELSYATIPLEWLADATVNWQAVAAEYVDYGLPMQQFMQTMLPDTARPLPALDLGPPPAGQPRVSQVVLFDRMMAAAAAKISSSSSSSYPPPPAAAAADDAPLYPHAPAALRLPAHVRPPPGLPIRPYWPSAAVVAANIAWPVAKCPLLPMAPPLAGGYGWVSFEVPATARMKGRYARDAGIAGVFVWSAGGDRAAGGGLDGPLGEEGGAWRSDNLVEGAWRGLVGK